MWLYIVQGVAYGFAAAVQPGPLQTYLITQALLKGWRRTLLAAFAPLLSDGPIIVLCLLVISQVPPWLQRFLYVAGGLFVLFLAYQAYRSWRDFNLQLQTVTHSTQQSLLQAALVNLLAPGPYLFWSLVTGPILLSGWREAPIYGMSFLAGFYLTMILILEAIIVLFGAARQFGPGVSRVLLGVSAVALLCFGLYQLWMGIRA